MKVISRIYIIRCKPTGKEPAINSNNRPGCQHSQKLQAALIEPIAALINESA